MPKQRRKQSRFIHIGKILPGILSNFQNPLDKTMTRIRAIWPDTVGDLVADNTQPAAFKEDTLFVHVQSAAWMQELYYLKADVIQKVNQALGEELIRDVRFMAGRS